MTLKNIGLLPAVGIALALWDHDSLWVSLMVLGVIVDWFFRWGWAAPEISETEQAVLDTFHAAQAEQEMPEGVRRLRVVRPEAEPQVEPEEGA